MSREKQRRLESTVAAIQRDFGPRALRPARELRAALPPHISTGFPALDAATGCGGLPLGALSLFSGRSTSGKYTVACKALACSQGNLTSPATVALLDLPHTADPDYLHRCGILLSHLIIVRPEESADGLPLLLDIVQSGQVGLLVVDGVAEHAAGGQAGRRAGGQALSLSAVVSRLRPLARAANTAVLFLDEAASWQRRLGVDPAAALRRQVALHVEMRRERWLRRNGQLAGYAARAQVLRSLWRGDLSAAQLEIVFNGAVHARPTW